MKSFSSDPVTQKSFFRLYLHEPHVEVFISLEPLNEGIRNAALPQSTWKKLALMKIAILYIEAPASGMSFHVMVEDRNGSIG